MSLSSTAAEAEFRGVLVGDPPLLYTAIQPFGASLLVVPSYARAMSACPKSRCPSHNFIVERESDWRNPGLP